MRLRRDFRTAQLLGVGHAELPQKPCQAAEKRKAQHQTLGCAVPETLQKGQLVTLEGILRYREVEDDVKGATFKHRIAEVHAISMKRLSKVEAAGARGLHQSALPRLSRRRQRPNRTGTRAGRIRTVLVHALPRQQLSGQRELVEWLGGPFDPTAFHIETPRERPTEYADVSMPKTIVCIGNRRNR